MKTIITYFICSTVFVCLSSSFVHSQTKEIDSLEYELGKDLDDITRVRLLGEIAWKCRNQDLYLASDYCLAGLKLAEEINDLRGVADLSRKYGVILRVEGDLVNAYPYLAKSLEISQELGIKQITASAYNSLANLRNDLELYEQALEDYLKAAEIYEEISDSARLSSVYLNIGTIFEGQKKYEEALNYTNRTLEIIKDKNISNLLIPTFLNLGHLYELLSDTARALDSYKKSLGHCQTHGSKADSVDVYFYFGRFFNRLENLEKAEHFLIPGNKLALEIGNMQSLRDYSFQLSNYYEKIGDSNNALLFLHTYNTLNDSIKKDITAQSITLLEAERYYEAETKEQEERLRKSKFRSLFYIISLGLTIVFASLLYRNYRMKQKANRLLAEMDELKSRLFSNISHEFRTPLTLILGPLEQMMELEKDKKPSKKTIQMMQRNANRLLDLVNQMLDLSKVDAGSMKLELVEEEIFKALRVMILSFASLAEKKKIDYTFDLPVRKLVTWFDPDKLEKIVNNLLSNAFKFTPEKGKVKIEVRIEMPDSSQLKLNRLFITIEDSGKGIPKEELDHIFDRFYQAEGAAEIETVGTGIGLALTKELVEVMHGEISVESQERKGTKFSLELPVGKDHLNESEYVIKGSDDTKSDPKSSKTETIAKEDECEEEIYNDEESGLGFPMVLTVEDHEDIRTHIRENLEDCFRVMEAENGKSGLEKAIENVPDLIITDLMMPEMDGIELCKHLKTDERTSHIPVIMLTAKASVEDKLEGLETGADAYVTKPFNIKEVRLRVTKLIEQRNKLRERFSKEITLEPKDIAVTSTDERFLQKAMTCIEEHMGDSDFDVRQFQEEMLMSRMQLFRKLKALTNHTPSEFIRNLRLKRAAKLLEGDFGNVAEVCYEVGFNNLSYFAKCFKELFMVLPSEYSKKTK